MKDSLFTNRMIQALSYGNSIHEGTSSTQLGLKGSPTLSEVLTLERDILMANYAESRLLVHKVSCKESVDKLAEQQSDRINSSVAYLNLIKTDEHLLQFDVNYKCSPPLRSEEDKVALVQAVNNGQIKIICSNHIPLEEETEEERIRLRRFGCNWITNLFQCAANLWK